MTTTSPIRPDLPLASRSASRFEMLAKTGRCVAEAAGRVALFIACVLAVALAACGGGGPPDQTPLEKLEISGNAYGGDGNRVQAITAQARGTTGVKRTSTPLINDSTRSYDVSVSGLGAPFLIEAVSYTLAYEPGTADTSPLSDLVIGALFGRNDPGLMDAFSPGSDLVARVTPGNVVAAQARASAFLHDPLGLDVPSGIDLLGPISDGSPLAKLLAAYAAKRTALGETAYQALEATMVSDARNCIVESLDVAFGSTHFGFCPIDKSATADSTDPTLVVHVLLDRPGNRLEVHLSGSSVTSASYTGVDGGTYSCSAAGCAGMSVGTPLGDNRRPLIFNAATLNGAAGKAVVNGSVIGAAPGVVLPHLPCTVNGFNLVLPDLHVVSDCADNVAQSQIGLDGIFSLTEGTSRRILFPFSNATGTNGLSASSQPVTVAVELDQGALVRVTVARTDPATGAVTDIDYKCRASACNGVTLSPPTVNTEFGIELDLYDIRFDGTRLAKVGSDGALSTTEFALLSGSFKAIDYVSTVDNFMLNPPPNCNGIAQAILFTVSGETLPHGRCDDPNWFGFHGLGTVANAGGGFTFKVVTGNSDTDNLIVVTDASGAVVRAEFNATAYNERFSCASDCVGITVGPPDSANQRLLSLHATQLHEIEPDGFATGDRTAVGNGSIKMPQP